MGEWPDHDAIVRQAIGRYRASVEKAPQVDGSLPDEMARTIAGLVAENEQGEVLFRGEARSHASVSSSLFRALELPSDGDNFDRLVAHDRQTVGRTDESHGATRIARLSCAQHYSGSEEGSPTNLIDFTESLPIALYFASKDDLGADGRIVIAEKTAFEPKDDVDFCCRRTQRIRPSFYDDNRNIHQWSHFIYPANGVLEQRARRTVMIPHQYKAPILSHLDVNCGIREDTVFTYGQSWFETAGFDALSLNTHLLGVTMEWLGNRDEARRIYAAPGHNAAHESQLRSLELEGESREYTVNDALKLGCILSGKALALYNLALSQSHNGLKLDDAECLWMKALATGDLHTDVSQVGGVPGVLDRSAIFYELGRCIRGHAGKGKDPILFGRAIAMLRLAVHLREFEGWNGRDLKLADMLFELAEAEQQAGMRESAGQRLTNLVATYSDHPGIDGFQELLARIRQS